MKYVTFAIMAVLIFGVAAAPVFSNGVAFAQTGNEVPIEEQNSVEEQETTTENEVPIEEQETTTGNEVPIEEQNSVEEQETTTGNEVPVEEQNSVEDQEATTEKKRITEERKQYIHQKLAIMKENNLSKGDNRELMKEKRDLMKERYAGMTLEEIKAKIQQIREERTAQREAYNNMSAEEKQALVDARIATMKEKRENYIAPRVQVEYGLGVQDIICPDDKELVIKKSNGSPICLGSNAVFILMDRGVIVYPE